MSSADMEARQTPKGTWRQPLIPVAVTSLVVLSLLSKSPTLEHTTSPRRNVVPRTGTAQAVEVMPAPPQTYGELKPPASLEPEPRRPAAPPARRPQDRSKCGGTIVMIEDRIDLKGSFDVEAHKSRLVAGLSLNLLYAQRHG